MQAFGELVDKIAGDDLPDESKKILLAAFLGTKAAWVYSKTTGVDPLKADVFTLGPLGNVNWWILSHAATYALVGMFYPNNHAAIARLGITFEVWEAVLSMFMPGFWRETVRKQLGDIAANHVGYAVGSLATKPL